jgi:hypothetical protein
VKKRSRFYPRVRVDTAGVPAVGQAGGVLLIDTVAAACLDAALSAALAAWRKLLAVHDPGKVVWTVPASVDTVISCPVHREIREWARHAVDLPRSTRLRR